MAARQTQNGSPRVDIWALGSYGVDKICPDSSRARGLRELGFWDGRLSRWPAILIHTKALGHCEDSGFKIPAVMRRSQDSGHFWCLDRKVT